jgi:glycosyltransferase involved in cell wall biosynthesis
MKPLRLVIVTPLMPPAPGGAGIYTDTISRALIQEQGAEVVCVITEKHPNALDDEVHLEGRYRILRRFPFRAGSATKTWRSYFAYAKQNLQYGQLWAVCKEQRATTLLIHSSLHNNPNVWPAHIPRLRRLGLRLVSDVRDPLLPPQRFRQLYQYDQIIACSQSVVNHLQKDNNLASNLNIVPIPITVEEPELSVVEKVLERHSLTRNRYLLSTNGILLRKGLRALVALAREIDRRGLGIAVVVAGKARDRTNEVDNLIETGIIRYLGILPHADVLSLSAAALANINLSPVEGMPRTTLETLAVDGNVIVTKGIPEFDALQTDAIVDPEKPDEIADLISRMISTPVVFPYDISQHNVATTVKALHTLLSPHQQ